MIRLSLSRGFWSHFAEMVSVLEEIACIFMSSNSDFSVISTKHLNYIFLLIVAAFFALAFTVPFLCSYQPLSAVKIDHT